MKYPKLLFVIIVLFVFQGCCPYEPCEEYYTSYKFSQLDSHNIVLVRKQAEDEKLTRLKKAIDSLDTLIKVSTVGDETSFLKQEMEDSIGNLNIKCKEIFKYTIVIQGGFCQKRSNEICNKYTLDKKEKCISCVIDSCKKEITPLFNELCPECKNLDY